MDFHKTTSDDEADALSSAAFGAERPVQNCYHGDNWLRGGSAVSRFRALTGSFAAAPRDGWPETLGLIVPTPRFRPETSGSRFLGGVLD